MKRKPITLATSLFIVSMGLMLITWLAATLLAFAPILDRLLNHTRFDFSLQTATDSWLVNDNRVVLISGSLLIAGYVFWFIARRLTRSQSWWASEGCPQCRAHVLTRVRRQRTERLIGELMKLPLGRYACRHCTWEGLRLVGYKPGREKSAAQSRGVGMAHAHRASQPAMAITAAEVMDSSVTAHGVGANFHRYSATAIPMPGSEMDRAVDRVTAGESWINTLGDYAYHPFYVAMVYLGALTVAEVMSVLVLPTAGVTLHIILLFLLLLHAAFTWDKPVHRFLLALTLVPLIRVISLSLPLVSFSLPYWFFITSVPLFAAAYTIMRQLKFSWRDLRLQRRSLPLQLLIGLTGFLLGFVEYLILKPDPLIDSLSWQQVWLPATILLVCTGFLEEFVFRFLMQRTSIEQLGRMIGIVFVAIIFAIMHIGYRSVTDFLFVFLVGLFFGFLAWRTRSIVGVTISHGLTNIMVFLILPFLLLSIGDAPFARTKSQLNIETRVIPAEAPILSAPLPDTMKSASDDYPTAEQFSPVLSQEFNISGSEHSSHKAFLKVENPSVSIKVIGAVGVKKLAEQLCHFYKDNDSKAQDQRNYRNVKHFAQGSCRVI